MTSMRVMIEAVETSKTRFVERLVESFCEEADGAAKEKLSKVGGVAKGKWFPFSRMSDAKQLSSYWDVRRTADGLEVFDRDTIETRRQKDQPESYDYYWDVKIKLTATKTGVEISAEYDSVPYEGGKKHIETLSWREAISGGSDLQWYVDEAMGWVYSQIRRMVEP